VVIMQPHRFNPMADIFVSYAKTDRSLASSRAGIAENFCPTPLPTTHVAFLLTNNHSNKNRYNNCSGDKQSNSQTLIPLAAIPHKEAYHH
jgi:hypothetical protein